MKAFKPAYAIAAMALLLTGCNLEEERPESASATAVTTLAATESTTAATTTTPEPEPLKPDEVIPPAEQTPRIEGSRLSYTIKNVYSAGKYYTVDISCIKLPETNEAPELETTVIDGSLYGDFRLDLLQQGNIIDTLKINVPRDDGFLIFENVLKDLTYGCEIISNMRDFAAEEYPDLIQLDFTILNEVEVPQYARFFAISNGKLVEIPVYENGVETAPYGTHLEPQYAGMMIQHIVAKEYGTYTVKQYEYTYDPESLTINRKRVRYTGYN